MRWSLFILVNLIFTQAIELESSENVITFTPSKLTVESGKSQNVTIKRNSNISENLTISFTYGDENKILLTTDLIELLDNVTFVNTDTVEIQLKTLKVGHLVLGVKSDQLDIPLDKILRLDIIHSSVGNTFISIIGWIYFIAWSVSFYPQVILNFQTKDVSGLSLDFIVLNFLGFFCYSVFNICLYSDNTVIAQYFQKHPRGVDPVLLNDVFFSFHAVLITFITIVQCLVYKQRSHRVSFVATGILIVLTLFLTISGFVCAASKLELLDYIYFFSYVKLAITIMKYCPQAYLNFKRKSTVGWSIGNVLLDFTGGSFSLLQMFLLAYNYNDWTSIFGSPTKLGLGLLSIFFDLIFMFQHYILYRSNISDAASYTPIH